MPHLLAQGYDGFKETFNIVFCGRTWQALEDAKQAARDVDPRGKGLVPVDLGGERLQMHGHGRRGASFLLTNDHFDVVIRSREMEWAVSIEYRAAGLWAQDIHRLRDRAKSILAALGKPNGTDWQRLSMVHWCFDFYSPEFSAEISEELYRAIVCISRVKKDIKGALHGAGARVETVTVGSKASLQVQIYDKGREIREVSGKEWMAEVYQRGGHHFEGPITDVWRVEIRCAGDWLKNRNIKTFQDFSNNRLALLHEALDSRRLTVPTEDSNRARWPLHPVWQACTDALETWAAPVPLGRVVTGRRSDLLETAIAGIAGYLRSAVILDVGCYDVDTLREVAERAAERAMEDPDGDKKAERALERYRYVDFAA